MRLVVHKLSAHDRQHVVRAVGSPRRISRRPEQRLQRQRRRRFHVEPRRSRGLRAQAPEAARSRHDQHHGRRELGEAGRQAWSGGDRRLQGAGRSLRRQQRVENVVPLGALANRNGFGTCGAAPSAWCARWPDSAPRPRRPPASVAPTYTTRGARCWRASRNTRQAQAARSSASAESLQRARGPARAVPESRDRAAAAGARTPAPPPGPMRAHPPAGRRCARRTAHPGQVDFDQSEARFT